MANDVEIRGGIPAEIRQDGDGSVRVSGHAAVFDQEADIGGMFREKIAPGAFANAIGRDDVVLLVNHEGLPLARTRSGTLKLEEDDIGLRIESELDANDPDVRAVEPKMRRGDLDKMSFAFRAVRQEFDDTQDPPLRTIHEVELFDVSIVTTPAFDGTDIGLRALAEHRQKVRRQNFHAARVRLRGKMNLALRERENGTQ